MAERIRQRGGGPTVGAETHSNKMVMILDEFFRVF